MTIDLFVILWVGNLDRVHLGWLISAAPVSAGLIHVSGWWISQVLAVPGRLMIAEGDGGAGPHVSHHPPS